MKAVVSLIAAEVQANAGSVKEALQQLAAGEEALKVRGWL